MAKRSVWAAQTRKRKRALRAGAGFFKRPLPADDARIVDLSANPQKFSRADKIDFLRLNHPVILRVMERISTKHLNAVKVTKADAEKYAKDLETKSETEFNESVAYIAKMKLKNAVSAQMRKQLPELKKFLADRGLPFDNNAFTLALVDTMKEYALDFVKTRGEINLKAFEKKYVTELKALRTSNQYLSRVANISAKRVFHEIRLTQNQLRQARKWVINNAKKVILELEATHKITLGVSLETDKQWVSYFKEGITKGLRKTFEKQWVPKTPESKKATSQTTQSPTKLGNRLERMTNYSPVIEEPTETKTAQIARPRQQRAFDLVDEAIRNISRDNELTAHELNSLVRENVLSPTSLIKLHDRGSLAQKTFITAMSEKRFLQEFQPNEVNALARMISFIGPMGKQIPKVKRAAQSSQSEKLFSFLERKGLIERHSGGNVVYLTRR